MLVTIQVDKDSSVFIELLMTCGDRKKKPTQNGKKVEIQRTKPYS